MIPEPHLEPVSVVRVRNFNDHDWADYPLVDGCTVTSLARANFSDTAIVNAHLKQLVTVVGTMRPIEALRNMLWRLRSLEVGKVDQIKLIRDVTGCGLREAKDIYDAQA